MTQGKIAETVGISRRQVGRILEKVGINRGSTRMLSEGSRRKAVPVAGPVRHMASLRHQQALFKLAVSLRDEMTFPLPHEFTRSGAAYWLAPWKGPIDEPPKSVFEEETLCPFLRDHLLASDIWLHLEALRQGMACYRDLARRLASMIVEAGRREAEALRTDLWSEALKDAFVPSVMLDAYHRTKGLVGIEFAYRLRAVEEAGDLGLRLSLGEGSIRVESQQQADFDSSGSRAGSAMCQWGAIGSRPRRAIDGTRVPP